MKNLFTNIIIAIVCFTLGYVLYPSINDTKIESVSTNETSENKNLIDDSATEEVQKTVSELSNEKIITNSPEQLASIIEDTEINNVNTNHQVSTEIKDKVTVTDEAHIVVQEELEEWSVIHKEQINELISAHMSSETAEHMKMQILKDNEFLSQPPINQDPIEDENWAYNMEQQLKVLISQHELSDAFELLNLSCKQLMCDILGVEKEGNTWFKVYISLLQTAPNAEFPNGNNAPKSVQYMEGDVSVVYSQIKFKSS